MGVFTRVEATLLRICGGYLIFLLMRYELQFSMLKLKLSSKTYILFFSNYLFLYVHISDKPSLSLYCNLFMKHQIPHIPR